MPHETKLVTRETTDERRKRLEAAYAALPDKPSELIRLAVADLQSVRNDPRYVIDMDWYFENRYKNKQVCTVCLGGAVLARHVELNPKAKLHPFKMKKGSYLEFDGVRKIKFLDCVRRVVEQNYDFRSVETIFEWMTGFMPNVQITEEVVALGGKAPVKYADNPDAFIAAVERVADAFEESGQ